ncbi:MAG: ECF transporter S component [Clostridia bacterium]|nr:ECF transporter S component [Clostridia bacterium]
MDVKETFRKAGKKITPAYITKVALLTGIAYLLYLFVKIKLPFMFPSFLEMQFSELPAILAGFSLGPAAGVIVVILKCLLKFPFSSTIYVGEWTDMVLGVMYVLPASIIYALHKNKKNAIIGLAVGTFTSVIAAMILNRFVSVPFFVELYFEGDFAGIVGFLSVLYPKLTEENFYPIYLFAGVLPFNLIRLALMSLLTFFVYKRLSKALHWEFGKKTSATGEKADGEEKLKETPDEEQAEAATDSEGEASLPETPKESQEN